MNQELQASAIEDLNSVLGNWNAGTPPTSKANIPEPGTAGVLLAALATLFTARGRR